MIMEEYLKYSFHEKFNYISIVIILLLQSASSR